MQTNNNNQFNTSEAKKHQLFLVLYTFQIQNRIQNHMQKNK